MKAHKKIGGPNVKSIHHPLEKLNKEYRKVESLFEIRILPTLASSFGALADLFFRDPSLRRSAMK